MSEPTYRQAFSRSAYLIWHHKTIWIFGVLSLLLGQFGWNNFIGSLAFFGSPSSEWRSYFMDFPWPVLLHGQNFFWSMWLLLVIAAVSVLVVFVSVASEGALIAAATGWFLHGKNLRVEDSWKRGVKHFWRLFVLHVLKKVVLVGLLFMLNTLILHSDFNGGFFKTLILVLIITSGIVLSLAVSTIGIFAAGYIVEREFRFEESLRRAIALFQEHFLVSFELSVLLLIVQVAVIFLFMLSTVWFLVPFFSFVLVAGFTGATGLVITGMIASVGLFFLIAAIVGGILNAFSTAAWMYMFMKMDHEGVGSRIVHFIRQLSHT